jgi:hypothetical protein
MISTMGWRDQGDLRPMNYSVNQAARLVGKSRMTINRAIASGTLSHRVWDRVSRGSSMQPS